MNITVDRAVIEQALEALETIHATLSPESVLAQDLNRRSTALRTALEQPEQEPVAYIHETGFLVRNPGTTLTAGTKLYAAPRCEWVGLTDEEYTELWGMKPDLLNFFRKIEAKLKEKNT